MPLDVLVDAKPKTCLTVDSIFLLSIIILKDSM